MHWGVDAATKRAKIHKSDRGHVLRQVFARQDNALAFCLAVSAPVGGVPLIIMAPYAVLAYWLFRLPAVPIEVEARIRAKFGLGRRTLFRATKGADMSALVVPGITLIRIPSTALARLDIETGRRRLLHELGHRPRWDWCAIIWLIASTAVWVVFAAVNALALLVGFLTPKHGDVFLALVQNTILPLLFVVVTLSLLARIIHRREYLADDWARSIDQTYAFFLQRLAAREAFTRPQSRLIARWNALLHPSFADRLESVTRGSDYTPAVIGLNAIFFAGFAILFATNPGIDGEARAVVALGLHVLIVIVGGRCLRAMTRDARQRFGFADAAALQMGYALGFAAYFLVMTLGVGRLVAFEEPALTELLLRTAVFMSVGWVFFSTLFEFALARLKMRGDSGDLAAVLSLGLSFVGAGLFASKDVPGSPTELSWVILISLMFVAFAVQIVVSWIRGIFLSRRQVGVSLQ